MGILPITLIVLGFMASGAHSVLVNLTSDTPVEAFDEGRQVHLRCVADILTPFAVVSIRKRTPSGILLVVTNQVVEGHFRDTGRYKAEYNYFEQTKRGELDLNITSFNKSDAGLYYCRLTQQGGVEQESEDQTLIVKVPIDDVRMSEVLPNNTLHDVQDNDVVRLTVGRPSGIACIIRLKSYVNVPMVNVTINGVTSSDFVLSSVVKEDEQNPGTYEFIYKYRTTEPDYRIHGNKVMCVASTPGYDEISAVVTGEATFKPVIMCDQDKLEVAVGSDVEILCTVYSYPHADISAEYGQTYLDNSLGLDGNAKDKFDFITVMGDLANRTVAFKVSGITEGMIRYYKYRIKAESTIGTEFKIFTIEEKFVSSSSIPCLSLGLLIGSFISTVLLLSTST